ncbi:MAG: hypothetical protein H0T18_07465 [Chloroflexia bacterium]|nr:hypothetical protein [Chloroflexia bacterium]
MVVFALGLAACGGAADTGTEITPPAPLSPTAGEIPEETFQATVSITDEGLDPNELAGQVGTAFQLVVAGDGSEHTLSIQELVEETAIAASGETVIDFTVEGDPGPLQITLDGESAGTFERQSASGIADS